MEEPRFGWDPERLFPALKAFRAPGEVPLSAFVLVLIDSQGENKGIWEV